MPAIILTAFVAGFLGLSAGFWLKPDANTAAAAPQPASTFSVDEITRNAPRDLPVTEVADYM